MKQKVLLNIKSTHIVKGMAAEDMEYNVSGFYEFEDDMHKINYEEIADDKSSLIKNTFTFNDKSASLIRRGFVDSSMDFRPGEDMNPALYKTAYGDIDMGVRTYAVDICRNNDSITADIHYSLYTGEMLLSECKLVISIYNATFEI